MSVRVLHGDCLSVLPTLAAGSFHCCVTSRVVNPTILRYSARVKNDGRIRKGERRSPATEFKPGQHWRPHGQHREREWLEKQYVELQRSTGDIAREVGCTDAAILFWLKKHEIPRRTISKARAAKHWGVSGPANPMFGKRGAECHSYIDGGSPERQRQYSRAEGIQFLAFIFARDGWTCQRCRQKKGGKYSLHAHHIRAWARHPDLRFDPANVISLCRSCHLWVHSKKNAAREFIA